MYIETFPSRNSPPAILLRQTCREGRKTRERTRANLSAWPQEKIETFRRLLRGETLVSPQDWLTARQVLLEATEKSLTKAAKDVARRQKKLRTAAEIGMKVGKVLWRYKVGKHFDC